MIASKFTNTTVNKVQISTINCKDIQFYTDLFCLFLFIYRIIPVWNNLKTLKTEVQLNFSVIFFSSIFSHRMNLTFQSIVHVLVQTLIELIEPSLGSEDPKVPISRYVPQGTCLYLISSEQTLVFHMLGQMLLLPTEYSSYVRFASSHRIFF